MRYEGIWTEASSVIASAAGDDEGWLLRKREEEEKRKNKVPNGCGRDALPDRDITGEGA